MARARAAVAGRRASGGRVGVQGGVLCGPYESGVGAAWAGQPWLFYPRQQQRRWVMRVPCSHWASFTRLPQWKGQCDYLKDSLCGDTNNPTVIMDKSWDRATDSPLIKSLEEAAHFQSCSRHKAMKWPRESERVRGSSSFMANPFSFILTRLTRYTSLWTKLKHDLPDRRGSSALGAIKRWR